ncbi:nuclear transport factor 2 family protein [Tistrella bauzanensis]|uniref:Nuclear transport factor 2 family protein n=1 Tax=Tistrella arctica TaxID=3133430 RepID=A0ABU9YF96_9PROT
MTVTSPIRAGLMAWAIAAIGALSPIAADAAAATKAKPVQTAALATEPRPMPKPTPPPSSAVIAAVAPSALAGARAFDPNQVKSEIDAALASWAWSLNSGQQGIVVTNMYGNDAIMMSDDAQGVMFNNGGIVRYYGNLVAQRPDLKVTFGDGWITVLGPDVGTATGFYTFAYTEKGREVSVPARYTLIYRKTSDGWRIVSHHSSRMPQAHS